MREASRLPSFLLPKEGGVMIYLIAGIVWVLVAAGIFAYQAANPDTRLFYMSPFGVPFSGGWLALFFAGYCFLRWFLHRAHKAQMLARYEMEQRREEARLRRRGEERSEPPPPDPTFDFSDKPLPPPPSPEEKPQG
jgi:hypothetical protein